MASTYSATGGFLPQNSTEKLLRNIVLEKTSYTDLCQYGFSILLLLIKKEKRDFLIGFEK